MAFLVIVAPIVAGCGVSPAPEPSPAAATADNSDGGIPRLDIVERHGKRHCQGGIEHRHVTAVYSGPLSEDAVMTEARKLYESLRQDIQQSCPDAEFKRIWLLIYTDEREAGTGLPMVMFEGENKGTDPIPEWPPEKLTKRIRDEDTRPTPLALNIYFDWMKRIDKAQKQADQDVADPTNFERRQASYERQQAAMYQTLYRDWNITRDEFKAIWWHVHLWTEGMKATPEVIQEMVAKDDNEY
jgi:hypothetical protein